MRRLFWIGVGVGLTVVVVRYGRRLYAQYVPADAAAAIDTAAKVRRTARGVLGEFTAGLAEREAELRHDLIGDVDVEALRSERARDRADRAHDVRTARTGRGWADGPTEDPEDDGDDGLPYSFF